MARLDPRGDGVPPAVSVFLFFSNRLGCLPSLLLSAVITLIILLLTGVID